MADRIRLPDTVDDVTPELLLTAYANGVFPMGEDDGDAVRWYSPDPRTILDLAWEPGRHFDRLMRTHGFTIRIDHAFADVMRACSERPEGTWIGPRFIELYLALHEHGFAHSVETWHDGRLLGGLYGVSLGGAFMGESMFSRAFDASKVALLFLMQRLRRRGFILLDAQFPTEHLARFGAMQVPRDDYLMRLYLAVARETTFAVEPEEHAPPAPGKRPRLRETRQ